MSSIVLCNTGADSLSKIDLETFDVRRILFTMAESPVGPIEVKTYKDKLITANNYNDSISIFSTNTFIEELTFKIGPKPNDLVMIDEKIYTICGESNSIVVYDLNQGRVLWELRTGNWPHSIDFCKNENLIFVTNLEENCTNVIKLEGYQNVKNLLTQEYPTKVKVSKDNNCVYVCESYLGSDENGYLDVFSIKTLQRIARIEVGTSPMNMFEDAYFIYVSNFTDGSISIVDKSRYKVIKTLHVGGMPKGILKEGKSIYISDYLKGRVIVVEEEKIKKIIAIESEPNAMILL